MEPLSSILERVDVKNYITEFKINWADDFAKKHRNRTAMFLASYGWQWALHHSVLESINKNELSDLRTEDFAVLSACYLQASTWKLDHFCDVNEIYNLFFKDWPLSKYKNVLKRLKKNGFIINSNRSKIGKSIQAKLIHSKRKSTRNYYELSINAELIIKSYGNKMRSRINNFVKHNGEYSEHFRGTFNYLLNIRALLGDLGPIQKKDIIKEYVKIFEIVVEDEKGEIVSSSHIE